MTNPLTDHHLPLSCFIQASENPEDHRGSAQNPPRDEAEEAKADEDESPYRFNQRLPDEKEQEEPE